MLVYIWPVQLLTLLFYLFPFHGELSVRIAEKTAAIRENPNNLILYMQRGELHLQHENPDSAIIDYEYALKHGIDTSTIHVLAAEAYLAAGRYDSGLEQVNQFLRMEPEHLKGFHTRGKIYEAKNEFLKARADFTLVIEKAETARPQDYIHLANLHLKIDSLDSKSAIETLEFGISRLGNIVSLQMMIYELYRADKNYELAHSKLDEMMEPLNRKERLLVEKAELFLAENKPIEAAETIIQAENSIATLHPRFQNSGATKKLMETIEKLKQQL